MAGIDSIGRNQSSTESGWVDRDSVFTGIESGEAVGATGWSTSSEAGNWREDRSDFLLQVQLDARQSPVGHVIGGVAIHIKQDISGDREATATDVGPIAESWVRRRSVDR